MGSNFSGPQHRGAMRELREQKRIDAELRAQDVKHEDTRKHRLGKCDCGKE